MATLDQLKLGLIRAHQAGDSDSARKLAAVIKREQVRRAENPDIENIEKIPELSTGVPETRPKPSEPTLSDKIKGAGEALISAITGATGGALGLAHGTLRGIVDEVLTKQFGTPEAADRIEQKALQGAQNLTYAPRTETGQEYLGKLSDIAEPLGAAAIVAPELAALGASAARQAPTAVKDAASRVSQAARDLVDRAKGENTPPPGSAGAAAVEEGLRRQEQANELPVPIKLTEGQKTRDFAQQRFERETAKMPEEGEPLRKRFAEQNNQLQQNLDAFIDKTGAELTELRGIGETVDKALRQRALRSKNKIRALYDRAEQTGEMNAPVELTDLINHLNESAPEAEVANVLKTAKSKALQLGAATAEDNGTLISQPIPLKNAELLRRSINNATNTEPTNIRQAQIMKGLIDSATENSGGSLYKRARQARTKYANDYENIGVVKQLLGTKAGTTDRAIAMEDVLRKSVLQPSASLDTVKQVKRLLRTSGAEGRQAWKEIQGGVLRHIKDEATRNVQIDQAGNPVVSAKKLNDAINNLDKSGKLDFIFGKKGAEQLRTVNEVAKDVITHPPNAVNYANTASVLAGLIDVAISGTSGVPAPLMTSFRLISKQIKDKKLKARIRRALGETEGGD
jgi:hypothetical protein